MRRLVLGLTALVAAILIGPADTNARMIESGHQAAAAAETVAAADISAQRRRRGARVYIYGPPRLPPTAVRQCRAWYAPEYRLSGTVITPRMQCWWERG